jgi:hypothetical protein
MKAMARVSSQTGWKLPVKSSIKPKITPASTPPAWPAADTMLNSSPARTGPVSSAASACTSDEAVKMIMSGGVISRGAGHAEIDQAMERLRAVNRKAAR